MIFWIVVLFILTMITSIVGLSTISAIYLVGCGVCVGLELIIRAIKEPKE